MARAVAGGAADGQRARVARAIKACALFERVQRATREAVTAAAIIEVVPGGTLVVEQGTTPDALVILARGRARVERTTLDARTMPLGYRSSGDVLGETCLARVKRHTENATTMEEAEVVRIPLSVLNELLSTDGSLAQAVLQLLLARQRETEGRIESLLFRDVEGRLAEFLVKAADRWGVPTPKGMLISAPITHLEIAQGIGSTRETVTLTLGALRRAHVLDVAGRRLIVRDAAALAKRAAAVV